MKRYVAEAVGTFALVFCGTGAITINEVTHGQVGHTGIAMTFGLVVLAMVYAFGSTSGAHFNPAVTLALTFARKFSKQEVLPYLLSQAAGAFAASGLLMVLFPASATLGATLPSGAPWISFVLEFILTFILMLVIFQVAFGPKENIPLAGIIIGSVVLLEAMFAGPICGASMNPIRSLAPALVSGSLQHLWVYLLAPVAGALAAIPVHLLTQHTTE